MEKCGTALNNMNRYDYLNENHDLSLPDWGPYDHEIFGLSHIADKRRAFRADFFLVPGAYRRSLFISDCLKESGYSPWEVATDLDYYSYRQQIEAKDKTFCDVSFSRIDDNLRLARCKFVNHTSETRIFTLDLFCRFVTGYPGEVSPVLPDSAYWLDAVNHDELRFAGFYSHNNLTWGGYRRSEERFPGTVGGSCIGRMFSDFNPRGFGLDDGDTLIMSVPREVSDGFIALRFRLDLGKKLTMKLALGGKTREIMLTSSGQFECQTIFQGTIPQGKFELISCGGNDIRIDGFVVGRSGSENKIDFRRTATLFDPSFEDSPFPQSAIVFHPGIRERYALWWSFANSFKREHHLADPARNLNYLQGMKQPYWRANRPGEPWLGDIYMLPISVPEKSFSCIYLLIGYGEKSEITSRINALPRTDAWCEDAFNLARSRHFSPVSIPSGEKYRFSQERMASVLMTNISFPIYTKRTNIRHHIPARYFNTLYQWDSGFTGLGLLEMDITRAIENLNAYVTASDDNESAFILFGTPLPVQIYLFAEIRNRTQDRQFLEFFYPRLKHWYCFLAGHAASSTTRRFKSNLLQTWDYFYNSGGWDDYPPQWKTYETENLNLAPAVTTAHAIRFAKFLRQTAEELEFADDLPFFDQDIAVFTEALQRYSWDGDAQYFSYVVHDDAGKPVGFFRHESGVNYNMGLDGCTPLLAGAVNPEQRDLLFEKLASPEHLWTSLGLSTVDQKAPYYRKDGYWNGAVWMPHQWFFWKAALDYGKTEFARRIAMTALDLWKREVDESYNCYEHFSIESGRGCGCHHFGALSAPVLSWFGAYFSPGRFTTGFDTWIKKIESRKEQGEHYFTLEISGDSPDMTTVLFVSGCGRYLVKYNDRDCNWEENIPGVMEIFLPKNSKGTLTIKQVL